MVIPPEFRNAHIRDLNIKLKEALKQRHPCQGLLLHGSVGVGKTYTMCALVRDYICRRETAGKSCKRIVWDRFLINLRSTYDTYAASEAKTLQRYLDCDLLIIEDVGATTKGQESDYARRILTTILDYRKEQEKPTFYTSNKNIDELAASFDNRIGSRLGMFLTIELGGRDKRQPLRPSETW